MNRLSFNKVEHATFYLSLFVCLGGSMAHSFTFDLIWHVTVPEVIKTNPIIIASLHFYGLPMVFE